MIFTGGSGKPQLVGFVGLYQFLPHRSLRLSLVLFEPADRRCGYGHHILAVLLQALHHHRAVKTVEVEVVRSNTAALQFWQKMGFTVRAQQQDTVLLTKTVANREEQNT